MHDNNLQYPRALRHPAHSSHQIPTDFFLKLGHCSIWNSPAFELRRLQFSSGAPTRPGWGAASFAIHQKDDYFGTTLHRMIEYVDAGPIVGVDIFLVPKAIAIYQLRELVGQSLRRLAENSAQDLMSNARDLHILPFAWGSMRYTKQDYVDMTLVKYDIEKSALEMMVKAFGEADNVAHLRLVTDGEIYFYAPEKDPSEDAGLIKCFIHGHRFVNRFPASR